MKRISVVMVFALAAIAVSGGVAQAGVEERLLARAKSLLEHGRWSDARHEYMRLREAVATDDESMAQQAEFGLTVCAVHLDDNVAEQRMLDFLSRYPGSVHSADINFLLALHYCEQERFAEAKAALQKVPYKSLTAANREKYDMRMGYAEFVLGNHDVAYQHFTRIPPKSEYADHATYYCAYIHYSRGQYDEAYKGFAALRESEAYGKVIPYYIFQLEFARGNYKYAARESEALIAGAAESERPALMRIAAESWYRLEGYNKSLYYMKAYVAAGGKMERVENYILGYSAYRTTDYATAVDALKKVSTGNDELSQNASYHLADCYLRRGDKRNAIRAFAMAADDIYTNEVAEDALFNYGKLLFEMGGGTFNEAVNVLTRYVTRYPTSPRNTEARELLIAAYYNSKDYDAAYRAIRSFPSPDGNMKTALQKITYFKALEAFEQGRYAEAREALEESKGVGVSPKYNALCEFWLGEADYIEGRYAEALSHYNQYLKRAPRSEREYKMALYNVGYTHLALGDVEQAKRSFEGFLWLYKERDAYRADGFNRLADAQYMQRDYTAAIKSYEGAVSLATDERYYALYRRAVALGLLGKTEPKIAALKQIITTAEGDYADDAGYELGRTYVALERYTEAAAQLEKFAKTNEQSPYYLPAQLDLGLAYLNMGKAEQSLAAYNVVIKAAPQSQAAKDAMQSVREIYVAKGDIDGYFKYAKHTGVECDLSAMTRDSLSFRVAEKSYLAARNADAVRAFEDYLESFPKGYYVDDVLFYLSDCHLKEGETFGAIERMKQLVARPRCRYTEQVADRLAEVTFESGMYSEAASAARLLYGLVEGAEARRSAAHRYIDATLARNDDEATTEMMAQLEQMTDVEEIDVRRARLASAKVLRRGGNEEAAMAIYADLASSLTDAAGAESAYEMIVAAYAKGDSEDAENRIYALSESKTQHTYWLGKAFILLGDIYTDRGDVFQAKATYQSIIDGYSPTDDGIVEEAKERIKKLG